LKILNIKFPNLNVCVVLWLTVILANGGFAQEVKKKAKDPWFAKDKLKHFVVSAALAGAGYYVAHSKLKMRKENARAASAGVTLSIGLGKEIYDRKHSDTGFSRRDLAADAAGCGTGIAAFTTR
jgi:putative lipoprotein